MEISACTREITRELEYEENPTVSSTEDSCRAFQDAERKFMASEYHERLEAMLATVDTFRPR